MNRMCLECNCLNKDCDGSENQAWTNCIYKEPKGNINVTSTVPIMPREKLEERNVLISKLPVYKGAN